MKMTAVLVAIPNSDPPQVMALSIDDNIWFVMAKDLPPAYQAQVTSVIRGQNLEVLGAIFEGEL